MADWIAVIEGDCADPIRESEYNDWYNNVHIPDCFDSECYVKATRYKIAQPVEGKSKYLVIYEIHSDDIEGDMAKHMAHMEIKKTEGRISDLLQTNSKTIYKKIFSAENTVE
jgi:hypothetical protein